MMMWGNGHWFNNGSWGYGGYGGYGGYWWMGLVMMGVQILFWGLLIWFGVSLFRRKAPHFHATYGQNNALDILKERYARGEIDTEEFQRRKEDLMK